MRLAAPLTVLLLLSSCFPYLMPKDPIVAASEDWLGPERPSGVHYSGDPAVQFPVLPFRLWGLYFEEEVLFELAAHPVYAMIEITRVHSRDGEEAWFALVSEHTGLQHVVVGTDQAMELAQTFPAPVHDGRLRVIRLASDTHLEYDTAFHLPNGELLQATITTKLVGEPPPKRNGNAMNHSADRVLAVLDLEEYNWGRAAVFIEGDRVPVRQVVPLLPLVWRLEQTAGGLSWGGLDLVPGSGDVVLVEGIDDVSGVIEYRWDEYGAERHLVGTDRLTEHVYRFRTVGQALELIGAEVRQGEVSVFDVRFNPPLPDLRWRVGGDHVSQMVASSNGREGYMAGTVRVHSDGDRSVVDVLPAHPFWTCERPIRTRVQLTDDRARLRAEVTPELAAGGAGRDACFEQDREAGY